MRSRVLCTVLLAGLLAGSSCSRQPVLEPDPAALQQTYSVTGTVLSLKPVERKVVVEHQEIPGYMIAMTMPFQVRDTNELTGLIPGEQVVFGMTVTEDDAWIHDIEKTGVARNILPKNTGMRIVRDVEPLEVGDVLPDYDLVNQYGEAVRLRQFAGDVLVLSFVFTRCPLPQFCPLTSRKLVETQNQLLSEGNLPSNWRLLVVTIDPEYDTPERLKAYGETYGFDPEHCSLLTGELIDVTALGEQFGLTFWTEDGTINHNLRTIVVGADGIIRTNLIGNAWSVTTLVREVRAAETAAP